MKTMVVAAVAVCGVVGAAEAATTTFISTYEGTNGSLPTVCDPGYCYVPMGGGSLFYYDPPAPEGATLSAVTISYTLSFTSSADFLYVDPFAQFGPLSLVSTAVMSPPGSLNFEGFVSAPLDALPLLAETSPSFTLVSVIAGTVEDYEEDVVSQIDFGVTYSARLVYTYTLDEPSPVPLPASALLLLAGLGGLALVRRRSASA